MLTKTALLSLFVIGALWAQDPAPAPPPPPDPPACLSGPVTKGTVTLSCVLLDMTAENSGTNVAAAQQISGPLFQVKLSSTDPEVLGFRVGVTFLFPNAGVNGAPLPVTIWGTSGKVAATPVELAPPGNAASPSSLYRYTFSLASTTITGIQVQELKASSSQAF